MFGYINVNRKELSEKNLKSYQAYYCGLCRCLKLNCGMKGQILLNYDMTFLIILLTGLYEPENKEVEFVCKLHPTRKRIALINEITQYAAKMNVILAYYNFKDDWEDERNILKYSLAETLKKDCVDIVQKYPRQAIAIETYIKLLKKYEEQKEQNIDLVSGLTGDMLGELLAWKQDEWYEELKRLGFYMGKFIYLMDAYEDLKEDKRHNAYNPLEYIVSRDEQEFETICKLMMNQMMADCAKTFERLPILLHADIIRNILYSGVWSRYEYMQVKKKKRKK